MRTYRMGLIQTREQLSFSVDAIVQRLKRLEVGTGSLSVHQAHLNGKRLKEKDDNDDESQSSPKTKKR